VTFKGSPVAEGLVTFLNPNEGGAAEATIKAGGEYEVASGVVPGEYLVVVTPLVEIVDTDPGKSPPAPVEKKAPDIPPKYRMQGTTPLKASVQPGPNVFDFELKP
jgi:hypothetical protein